MIHVNDPHAQYRMLSVSTAPQSKLIVLLFEAAVRNLRQAEAEIAARHVEKAHHHLTRVQDILTELIGALDFNAGEIARVLHATYWKLYHLAVEADVRKDLALVQELIGHMSELRDAWQQAGAAGAGALEPRSGSNVPSSARSGLHP